MPQADLHFTSDQNFDASRLLMEIESTISSFDDSAGLCKGRGHRVDDYHHGHVLLRLSMLPKSHRDDAFAHELGEKLITLIKTHASAPCAVNVQIRFDLVHYSAAVLA